MSILSQDTIEVMLDTAYEYDAIFYKEAGIHLRMRKRKDTE